MDELQVKSCSPSAPEVMEKGKTDLMGSTTTVVGEPALQKGEIISSHPKRGGADTIIPLEGEAISTPPEEGKRDTFVRIEEEKVKEKGKVNKETIDEIKNEEEAVQGKERKEEEGGKEDTAPCLLY